jgi:hypothetical protein
MYICIHDDNEYEYGMAIFTLRYSKLIYTRRNENILIPYYTSTILIMQINDDFGLLLIIYLD